MHINLLGPLQITANGRAVNLYGVNQRAALALLALHAGESMAPSQIVPRLWGTEPPGNVRSRLRNTVTGLRRLLPEDDQLPCRLTESGSCYRLSVSAGAVDLQTFRRIRAEGRAAFEADRPDDGARLLRQALSLWRGPPLADVDVPGTAWPELAELQEEYLTTLEDRLAADIALGRTSEVTEELHRLVVAEPLRERLYALLMRALAADGRWDEALSAYEDARAVLSDQWGIEPGQELRELHRKVMSGAPLTVSRTGADPGGRLARASTAMHRISGLAGDADDPEREAQLLDAWTARIAEATEPHQGRIVSALGGTVVVVFTAGGHAERAVRSALAVRDAVHAGVREWPGGAALHTAITSGDVREQHYGDGRLVLTGGAVDACRRLVSAAPARRVLVGESAYSASRDAIRYRPWTARTGTYEAIGRH